MVREAKFSWDEADGAEPPIEQARIDDLDDDVLDTYLPTASNDSKADHRQGCSPKNRPGRQQRETERRHLAGADWLNNEASLDELHHE